MKGWLGMDNINKFQSIVILGIVLLGILLGQINIIHIYSEYLIMPSLIIMLFLVFVQIPLKDITKSFKNLKFTLTAICINFVWTPIIVFILGKIFLNNNPALLIGFVMLMVTPCTDWYLIFTGIAKGNVALGASILPLNFILQLLLLPIYIFLIAGSSVKIDILNLTQSMVVSLFIPLILATLIRKFIIKRKGIDYFEKKITPKACDYQGYFLNLAIISMFASQGKILLKNPQVLLQLLLPVLLFFIINLVVGQVVGRKIKLTREDNIALSLTTLARNSPIALAIAVSAFPNEPLISLALIIGPLIELPVLFLVSKILLNINNTSEKI